MTGTHYHSVHNTTSEPWNQRHRSIGPIIDKVHQALTLPACLKTASVNVQVEHYFANPTSIRYTSLTQPASPGRLTHHWRPAGAALVNLWEHGSRSCHYTLVQRGRLHSESSPCTPPLNKKGFAITFIECVCVCLCFMTAHAEVKGQQPSGISFQYVDPSTLC